MRNCEEYKKKLSELEEMLNEMLREKYYLEKCSEDPELLRGMFLVLSKFAFAFGNNNRTLRQVLNQDEGDFFNLMTNPFLGTARLDVLGFIKARFVGCERISIFDLYFLGADPKYIGDYLAFTQELANTLKDIDVKNVDVFHHSGRQNLNSDFQKIFQGSGISMTNSVIYQDHLHDRIWLGYQSRSETPLVGAYFGSSFNTIFKKPMIYNQLQNDEIETFISAIKSIS